jgi:hypothetical protein
MKTLDIKKFIRNLDIIVGCTVGCNYCYARINNNRFPVTNNFSIPELVEKRIKRIGTRTQNVYFMTSASDLSDWKSEWKELAFSSMIQNPQHIYLFLTKRPNLINFNMEMSNVWVGVTINTSRDVEKIKSKNYFATFEPLHEDLGEINLEGIDWIVIGTETGSRKGKVTAKSQWALNICNEANRLKIPIFMKSTLFDIVGEENFIQEFPESFVEKFKLTGKEV